MILRLVLFLLLYAVPPTLAALGLYHVLRPRLLERRARRQALLNGLRDCGSCGRPVDVETRDARFERGRWYHRACMQRLLKSV